MPGHVWLDCLVVSVWRLMSSSTVLFTTSPLSAALHTVSVYSWSPAWPGPPHSRMLGSLAEQS